MYSTDFTEEQKYGIISDVYKQHRSCGLVPEFRFAFQNSSNNSSVLVKNMLLLAL